MQAKLAMGGGGIDNVWAVGAKLVCSFNRLFDMISDCGKAVHVDEIGESAGCEDDELVPENIQRFSSCPCSPETCQ